MPAPALVKTWQFSVDNLTPVDTGSAIENRKEWFGVKEALKGFGSNPLTVIGSSDGSNSGMDATDRWVTQANLTTNAWIVLQSAAINPKFQICIQLLAGGWATNGVVANMQITVSRLAGFGVANGGTDGNATTRPTATDEDARPIAGLANSPTSHARRTYIWHSTDGEVTRIFERNATTGVWNAMWEWGKPRSPRTLWVSPCYYRFGFNVNGIDGPWRVSSQFLITAYKGATKTTDVDCHIAGPFDAASSTVIPPSVDQQNDWESATDYDTYRLYLNSKVVAGAKGGIIGELYDMRAGGVVFANGTRLPDTAPFTWIALSDGTPAAWLLPWNDTVGKFGVAP